MQLLLSALRHALKLHGNILVITHYAVVQITSFVLASLGVRQSAVHFPDLTSSHFKQGDFLIGHSAIFVSTTLRRLQETIHPFQNLAFLKNVIC